MDPHERKVRTIYEALKAKNWKGAMKLANGALQKFRDSAVIQSFKAVALEKLGKADEAFEICEKIRSVGTVDEQVLHTMGIIYKSMDRMDCLTEAYARAVDLKKNDLELMSGLFACYVRECAFAKQQQLAMRMYKAASQSEKYLWWMIVSLILQVWKRPSSASEPPLGVEQTLKLAQSFVKKQLDTKKTLHSYEALMLYIDLLYTQGNGDQVVELLESEIGASLWKQSTELKHLNAQSYLFQRDSERASEHLKDILKEQPDHWTCLCLLLDLYLPEKGTKGRPSWQTLCLETCQLRYNLCPTEEPQSGALEAEKAEEVYRFIQELLESEDEGRDSRTAGSMQRCAALMQLEYMTRKIQNGLSPSHLLAATILESYKKMGHFKCAPSDLKPYIRQLDAEGQDQLAVALLEEKDRLMERLKQADESERRNLCCLLSASYQMLASLPSLSAETASGLIQSCMELYGSDWIEGSTDFKDGAVLAAITLLLMHNVKGDPLAVMGIPVWKAFVILGVVCDADPHNPELNLAFAALSFLLGSPQLALSILDRLEIKNIQLDSVASHFSFPFIRSYCCEEAARKLSVAMWQLFSSQMSDVEEMTFTAYTQGTYTKILEFVSFKEQLEMSHGFYLIQSESSISAISEMHSSNHTPEAFLNRICSERPLEKATTDFFDKSPPAEMPLWTVRCGCRLSFNEDLTVRPDWLPPAFGDYRLSVLEWWHADQATLQAWNEASEDFKSQWRTSRISWMRVRWCLPHLLRRMWLLEETEQSTAALNTLLRETGTTQEGALEFLQTQLEAWGEEEDKMGKLHGIYGYFQSSVMLLGYLAPGVVVGDGASLEEFCQCIDLVCAYCDQMLQSAFNHLESDLSCWVKAASVILGAMLSEELLFLVHALKFWKAHTDTHPDQSLISKLDGLSGSLQSFLERILHYLGLISDMSSQRVAHSILLLMGVMQSKHSLKPFRDTIQGKDVHALAQFMQELTLEDYEKSSTWDLFPAVEVEKIEALLLSVFTENKKWAKQLTQMAEKLLKTLHS